jgi:hypothetical protein
MSQFRPSKKRSREHFVSTDLVSHSLSTSIEGKRKGIYFCHRSMMKSFYFDIFGQKYHSGSGGPSS